MPLLTRPVALVTGASRGIGAGIARLLASRGARIAAHYHRSGDAIEAVLASLPGDDHRAFAADLGEPEAAARLWYEATEAYGVIDVLVNNAGIYRFHPPLASAEPEWRAAWHETLATNLVGPATLSLLAAQAMAARPGPVDDKFGRGRIVNISSRGAFRGEPDAPAYAASKAGLNALGQSLARALAPQMIYVYTLAPGWVETDMATDHLAGPDGDAIRAQHPLGRITRIDELAGAVAYCALDAPPAMTGGIIDVNGASYLRS
jgi:NAD(P)-dependent dehydrogenase (short-subunit alcohol dehydrogenase family)